MEALFEYDNYIFDLYGTLIDIHTDESCDETWEKWIAYLDDHGIKHPALARFRDDFFHKDKAHRQRASIYEYPEIDVLRVYDELFTRYGNRKLSEAKLFEIAYRFREASRDYCRLFEGVPEFLKKLRALDKKVYILSNAQRSYTLYEIIHFNLDEMVDDFLISSDYGCMKPDKSFFDAIVRKHSLDRSRSVMLGDSYENDYRGAINAGLHAIWLSGANAADGFYKNALKKTPEAQTNHFA